MGRGLRRRTQDRLGPGPGCVASGGHGIRPAGRGPTQELKRGSVKKSGSGWQGKPLKDGACLSPMHGDRVRGPGPDRGCQGDCPDGTARSSFSESVDAVEWPRVTCGCNRLEVGATVPCCGPAGGGSQSRCVWACADCESGVLHAPSVLIAARAARSAPRRRRLREKASAPPLVCGAARAASERLPAQAG
jgi:hypothetical protein